MPGVRLIMLDVVTLDAFIVSSPPLSAITFIDS